jgi:hypothetical protein
MTVFVGAGIGEGDFKSGATISNQFAQIIGAQFTWLC